MWSSYSATSSRRPIPHSTSCWRSSTSGLSVEYFHVTREIRRHFRLAGTDEQLGVLVLERDREGGAARLGHVAPALGEVAVAFHRLRAHHLRDQLLVGRRVEQARDQAVQVGARQLLGRDEGQRLRHLIS
jgi:hypothetical protein